MLLLLHTFHIDIGYENEDEVMMSKLLVEEGFVQGGVVWVLELSCGICSDRIPMDDRNNSKQQCS